jgi:hypothetical protein
MMAWTHRDQTLSDDLEDNRRHREKGMAMRISIRQLSRTTVSKTRNEIADGVDAPDSLYGKVEVLKHH